MRRTVVRATLLSGITVFGLSSHARCDEPASTRASGEIAQKRESPVADLKIGEEDAFRCQLDVQPVMPLSLPATPRTLYVSPARLEPLVAGAGAALNLPISRAYAGDDEPST